MNYYYLLVIIFFSIGIYFILKNKPVNRENYIEGNFQIDPPIDFGYKMVWIAVKTNNNEELLSLINYKKIIDMNWEAGIKMAYDNGIYITPQIGDWKLIVGMGLPHGDIVESIEELESLLNVLSLEFEQAQFFGTHRVTEYHNWIKSSNGKLERVFNYIGESGETLKVFGKPSEIEKQYNFFNSLTIEAKSDAYWEREDLDYPNEEIVMQLAESWSVNPTKLSTRTDVKKELGVLIK